MAFLGFAFLILFFDILLKLMIIFGVIFLVAGLMLLKTHETIAIVLFILSGLNLLGFTAWQILIFNETIATPDGEVKIKHSVCLKYKEYIESMDIEKINELLDKYPEIIYYEIDDAINSRHMLLFYGLYHCNVDIMQCALNHSGKFNDPELNINSNFLRHFFAYMSGNTTDEIIDTVKFALEHGAEVVNKDWNLYERARKWVMNDGVVSRKDKELLELIKKYMSANVYYFEV